MKRTEIILCLTLLMAMVLTGCGETVELFPEITVSETQTIECTVDGFYEANESKQHTSYNVGYGNVGGKSGYAVTPSHYTSVETLHYVYLKNENGDVASFKISADCSAALAKLEGKSITLTYEKHENKLFTDEYYEWNGFRLTYSALVEANENNDAVTTAEQEGDEVN